MSRPARSLDDKSRVEVPNAPSIALARSSPTFRFADEVTAPLRVTLPSRPSVLMLWVLTLVSK